MSKQAKMGKRDAQKLAKQKWGPTADAQRGGGVFDRDSRFRLGFLTISNGQHAVQVVGVGSSWEEAFENSKFNLAAREQEKLMTKVGEDLRLMAENPDAYRAKMVAEAEELNRLMGEAQEKANEESERSAVAGNAGVGSVGQDDSER